MQLALDGVPTYPRYTMSAHERGQPVTHEPGELLAQNVVADRDAKAYLLGTPRPIPPEDQESLRRPHDASRRRGSAGGDAGTRATWRYYRSLAGED